MENDNQRIIPTQNTDDSFRDNSSQSSAESFSGTSSESNPIGLDDEAVDVFLECAKTEYDTQSDRMEKLTSKISLVFTISSAAIAYEITNLNLATYGIVHNIIVFLSLAVLFVALIILINVFCSIKVKRLQLVKYISIIHKEKVSFDQYESKRLILKEYFRINKENRTHMNNLFKRTNVIIVLISSALILYFISTFICC